MGQVVVKKKPEQKIRRASGIEPLKSYRVVEISSHDRDKGEQEEVGDILIAFPKKYGGVEILNTRTNKLLHLTNGYGDLVKCVRDFTIESITLTFDENEMPA